MALKSTIFRVNLQVNDFDRHYYQAHALTLARHPSETDERMMVRVLAFALHAGDSLAFGNGLSTNDEPDLWQKDLTGAIQLWIDVGLPEAKLLRKAAGRAQDVAVYAYGRNSDMWWKQSKDELARCQNLTVYQLSSANTLALAALARKNMDLQCSIQDGEFVMSDEDTSTPIERMVLQEQTRAPREHYRK